MTDKSDYLEEAILNHIFRGVAFSAVATVYVALFTVNPVDAGSGGTEAAYGGYARSPVTSAAGAWKNPASAVQGQVHNVDDVVFPVNIGPNEETITGVGIYDAATNGNLLYWKDITDFTVKLLMQPLFEATTLIIAEG